MRTTVAVERVADDIGNHLRFCATYPISFLRRREQKTALITGCTVTSGSIGHALDLRVTVARSVHSLRGRPFEWS